MKNRPVTFALTINEVERFAFHAVDAADAERKALRWFSSRGMHPPACYAVTEGASVLTEVRNDWVS